VEIFSRLLAKYFIPKGENEKMTGEIRKVKHLFGPGENIPAESPTAS
jgi:hypothetical protein